MSVNIVKNKPFIYGLTGGIASGKSTASSFFKSKGIKVFDSDNVVKEIWANDFELINLVNNKYNIDIKTPSGKKTLRNIIFNNIEDLEFINSIVHPKVFKKVNEFKDLNINEKFIIIDMPLLFEVGYQNKVDKTILIFVNEDTQIKRLMTRDNISKDDANLIINNQMSLETKKEFSNYVIDNNGNIDSLITNLERLYEEILNENK